MKVLFVCTGNICRSPMAQIMLSASNLFAVNGAAVSSAGTQALNGRPMHTHTRTVLEEMGFSQLDFQSRMLTPTVVEQADLVLGFSRAHRAMARQLAPSRWRRAFTLREFADVATSQRPGASGSSPRQHTNPTHESLDIDDPVGKQVDAFRALYSEIGPMISTVAGVGGAGVSTNLKVSAQSCRQDFPLFFGVRRSALTARIGLDISSTAPESIAAWFRTETRRIQRSAQRHR